MKPNRSVNRDLSTGEARRDGFEVRVEEVDRDGDAVEKNGADDGKQTDNGKK
jgi:hypothetical protein